MSSFYGNGGYSSGGGGGSGEVISVNGKKGQVTLNAADVHALPEDTLIPSLEGFATEEWIQGQGYATEEKIPTHIVNGSASGSIRGINTKLEDSSYEMGKNAWAEGYDTMAKGENSHAECGLTTASGVVSHAEGGSTVASGAGSHAEGMSTTASKTGSHAEGTTTTASGQASHAEGTTTTASGKASHAEGTSTKAQEYSSHAEGSWTTASGAASHTEGMSTTASGIASHAENMSTKAVGDYSHAEGNATTASGPQSHAEGISTTASGMASHAEGGGTTAQGYMQHVMGEYNVPQGTQDSHTSSDYIFIVGNGTAQNPSNAFAMKWDGTFVFANDTEITPAQFTSLYNINNKIPLTGNETEGQVLIIDKNGNPKWDNTSSDMSDYYTKSETYSKTEVDDLIESSGSGSGGGSGSLIVGCTMDGTPEEGGSVTLTSTWQEIYDAAASGKIVILKYHQNISYLQTVGTDNVDYIVSFYNTILVATSPNGYPTLNG